MNKICLEHFPEHLTRQPFWFVANDKKIPQNPNTGRAVTGERLPQCVSFNEVSALIKAGHYPFAVFLHNQKEPCLTLDLDKARDARTGQPLPWVCPLFEAIGVSSSVLVRQGDPMDPANPALEVSWSGTGYHLFMSGKTRCDFGKRCWLINGKAASGKADPKAELIVANNLITPTGFRVPGAGQRAFPVQPLLDYLKVACPDQHQPCPVIDCPTHLDGSTIIAPSWRGTTQKELTPEHIADMLAKLNPDCDHDRWKQIGMAVHDWDSGTMGKELWEQWSQGGSKYDSDAQKAIKSAWKSFRTGKGIGTGSLVKMALDAGYTFPRPAIPRTGDFQKGQPTQRKAGSPKIAKETTKQQGTAPEQPEKTTAASKPPLSLVATTPINDTAALKAAINADIEALVTRYNQQFVHTLMRSKNVVMCLKPSPLYPQQKEWIPMPVPEFKQMMSHESPILTGISQKNEPIYKNPATVWIGHEKANFCQDCIFRPINHTWINGKLNLYQGFGVEPVTCDWTDPDVNLWYQHLHQIVCQGKESLSEYVINWLAHMIQKPEQKPKTAIIMKGRQGTGKGSLIEPILDIMGVHGAQLTRSGSVTGRFNAILENKVFLFADEAVFNNRQASNILKAMVSEKLNTTERKGLEQNIQQDFARIIMAADDDHIIKVSGSERRYLFLQLSDDCIQDFQYFSKLKQAKRNGLPGKLLYLLQHHDISLFLPMELPKSDLLTEEKLHDLKPEEQFIFEALQKGGFSDGGWPARIDTLDMQRHFREWLENRHIKFYGSTAIKLGNVLKKMKIRSKKRKIGTHQLREYEVKNVEYSRSDFERYILNGSEVEW